MSIQAQLNEMGFNGDAEVLRAAPLAKFGVTAVADRALASAEDAVIGPLSYASLDDVPQSAALSASHIPSVDVLDAQVGVHPRETIPQSLRDLVMGDEEEPPAACFAIVDGAAVPQLPDALEASGLAHQCLFKEPALSEFGEAAPWLVQLEPDADFTRALFTVLPNDKLKRGLWGNGAAVFLRSRGSLEALTAHFRHFTMLMDPSSGKYVFFRFYAPETLRTMVAHMEPEPREEFAKGIARFFCTDGRGGCFVLGR
jgi:hypothetical protein